MKYKTNYLAISILFFVCVFTLNYFFEELDRIAYFDSLNISQVAQVASSLNNGLILNYTFDEGSGTTVTDVISSVAGTLVGGPTWTQGKVGSGALQFDGVDDYVDTSNITSLNSLTAQTVCAWVKLDNAALTNQSVMSKISGSTGLFFQTWTNSSFAFGHNGSNFVKSPTGVLQSNVWQHLCGTYDNSLGTNKYKLYLDASPLTIVNAGTPDIVKSTGSNTENFQVNKLNSYNRWLKGSIDDVRIYNRELSQQEITDLFNNTTSNVPTAPVVPPNTPTEPVPPTVPNPPTNTSTLTTPNLPGVGYIEAESGSLSGNYKSENGYVYSSTFDSWQASYTVNVPADDNYYVAIVANYSSKFDRYTVTMDNSITSSNSFTVDPIANSFNEVRVYWTYTEGSNLLPLTAGSHTLKISGIGANVKIDKVRIVRFPDMYSTDQVPSNIITSGKVFVQNSQLNLAVQDTTAWYANTDGFVVSLRANLSKVNGYIALPGVLPNGTYNVFAKFGGNKEIQMNIAGEYTPKVTSAASGWTLLGKVITKSDTHRVFIDVFKSGVITTRETATIEGIYITNNLNERVLEGNVAIDLSRPEADTTVTNIKKVNLIPNSSFEVGVDANWGFFSSVMSDFKSSWDTSTAYDGRASFRLPLDDTDGWPQLSTRAYHLKPNKKYTFSFWAKTNPGKSIPFGSIDIKMLNTYTPPKGSTYGRETVLQKIAVTDQWKRFSVTGYAIAYPTSDYQFLIETNGAYTIAAPNDYLWIDAVQLEEGDLSDTYIPSQNLEVMINTNVVAGIFNSSESQTGQITFYNAGTTTESGLMKYEIYDYLNSKVKEGSLRIDSISPKEYKAYSIDLSTGKNGTFRISYWIDNINGSDREQIYSIVPQPLVSGLDPSSFMGIHAYNSEIQMQALKKLGIKWTRISSPSAFFRWNLVEPSEGTFNTFDDKLRIATNNGISVLGTIHGSPVYANGGTTVIARYGPVWAMEQNGLPKLDKWENYVKKIVAHYGSYVKYWEIWNEPNQQKLKFPLFSEAFYADMLKRSTIAIKSIDPSANIVAMGGTDAGYMKNVYQILEAGEPGWVKKNIPIFSSHAYPGGHPAVTYYDPIISNAGIGMTVWNTEAGVWDLGFYQGDNANFLPWGFSTNISERFSKGMLTKAEDLVKNFIETIGYGQTKYFYYDSRIFSSLGDHSTHPTIFEYDGTLRPKGAAYAVAGSFIDHSSIIDGGNLKLNNSVSAYLFNRSNIPTLVIWSDDKQNRQLRTTLNSSQYTIYDIMGNQKSSASGIIEFGRTPIYVVGKSGISVSDFKTKIKSATIESRSDILPPKIIISDAPRGVIKDSNFRIRWFALDETHVPQVGAPDNPETYTLDNSSNSFAVFYQYRLVGKDDSWSPWNTDIYYDYSAIPSGNYRFEVRAKDGAGNISNTAGRDLVVGDGVVVEVIPDSNPCTRSSNDPQCPTFIPIPLPQGTDPDENTQATAPVNQPVEVQDSDNDGVINTFDRCPNTPLSLRTVVNNYGCPRPKVNTFDIKPDFNSDLTRISNLEIGKKVYGKILFKKDVQVLKDVSNYKDQLDIDSNLIFSQNKVTLNSSKIPELNKDAVITMYNIKVKNPKILKDGAVCNTCVVNSYINGTVVFTVAGFSTYEIVENEMTTIYTPIVVNTVSNNIASKTINLQGSPKNNLAKQAITNSTIIKNLNQSPLSNNPSNPIKQLTLAERIDNYINEPMYDSSTDFDFQSPSYKNLLFDYLITFMHRIADVIISLPSIVNI